MQDTKPLTSIAVLPFVFLNEVEERQALSLGFADALITMLGSLEDFAVLPTSAILNYVAGTEPAQTCRNLGVRHVLQGNVQRLGSHWRVSMQLFDSMTQKIAYSEKHDFVRENVFEVQDEIGRRVVESLQSRFPRTVTKSRDRYSSDPEAFDEFMAGLRESYPDSPEESPKRCPTPFQSRRARSRIRSGACLRCRMSRCKCTSISTPSASGWTRQSITASFS